MSDTVICVRPPACRAFVLIDHKARAGYKYAKWISCFTFSSTVNVLLSLMFAI